MLLTIDVGNTNIVLGLYSPLPASTEASHNLPADGKSNSVPMHSWRMRTDARMTADELALTIRGLLGEQAEKVTGISALSTVPALLRELRVMLDKYFVGLPRVLVEPGVRTGVPLLVDNPKEVGSDRVVNTLAAHYLVGGPCVVVDFGTSTNLDVVSAKGEFLGGAIAPGIDISVDALASRAAQLRKIELIRPRSVIGKNTVECLQAGILFGFAGQVDGLVRRIVAELAPDNPDSVTVLATGGLAPLVLTESETIQLHLPELTLFGLRLIFERNSR